MFCVTCSWTSPFDIGWPSKTAFVRSISRIMISNFYNVKTYLKKIVSRNLKRAHLHSPPTIKAQRSVAKLKKKLKKRIQYNIIWSNSSILVFFLPRTKFRWAEISVPIFIESQPFSNIEQRTFRKHRDFHRGYSARRSKQRFRRNFVHEFHRYSTKIQQQKVFNWFARARNILFFETSEPL